MDKDTIYIRDDLGHAWFYKEEREANAKKGYHEFGTICMVLAEMEMIETGTEGENGYPCDSLEEGIKLLNEMGYISGEDDDYNLMLQPHEVEPPDPVGSPIHNQLPHQNTDWLSIMAVAAAIFTVAYQVYRAILYYSGS